nr:FRIGIDA-like protein 3 [Tanacetum cinerariifolium]
MEDTLSVATLLESTTAKIQQLQKAFAELESHRALTLNMKWKQIEDHFHGLEKNLKRRFTALEDQEKEFKRKTFQSQQVLKNRQADVLAKEEASLDKLQEKRDAAVTAITARKEHINSIKTLTEDEVKALSNPQLVKLCKEMDSKGLHKFISDNRRNLASIKEEIPIALRAAVDPGGLVLDSLSGFYISEATKNSNLLGVRRTCIMLMECLSILLTNLDVETLGDVIDDDVKERAKAIAEEWKPKLNDINVDGSNGNSLEAHAFLQLVATFGIDSGLVQDDLLKLIPMVCRRRQTADLCRFLGLSEKMPEQFSPVSLLNSYLTESRRQCSPTAQNDANEKEVSALKSVIKCIEDHKLENQYPLDPLQKRILQLEKAKTEKKRATEVSKPQHKRPRANGVAAGYMPRNTNYPRMSESLWAVLRTTWFLTMGTIMEMVTSIRLLISTKFVGEALLRLIPTATFPTITRMLIPINNSLSTMATSTNISQQQFGNSQQQSQAETQQEEEDETIPTLSSKKPGSRGKRVKKWRQKMLPRIASRNRQGSKILEPRRGVAFGDLFIEIFEDPRISSDKKMIRFGTKFLMYTMSKPGNEAFRFKVRDDPCAQLLDIRDVKTLRIFASPNLRVLGKSVVNVEYRGEAGDGEGFVKRVKEEFKDFRNTSVVILDNEEYFQKYKFLSAVDAFKKVRDDPCAQMLDIRDVKTLRIFASPNLRVLGKSVVNVEYRGEGGDDEGFVKRVKEEFKDFGNTSVVILD